MHTTEILQGTCYITTPELIYLMCYKIVCPTGNFGQPYLEIPGIDLDDFETLGKQCFSTIQRNKAGQEWNIGLRGAVL